MNRYASPQGAFDLTRFPEDPNDQFRAWDASDEYLLRHLAGDGDGGGGGDGDGAQPVDLSGTVVVLGDRWGALSTAVTAAGSTALATAPGGDPTTQITDSHLTQQATRANLKLNGLAQDAVRLLTTRDPPPERIDLLLVRIPKSLALLEDQLHRLAPSIHAGTVVIGTGMVTEIHTSTLQAFERILGPTRTSLAVKKARLIFCTPTLRGPDPELPAPTPASRWPHSYALPSGIGAVSGLTVTNHAGIFSAEHLDIGTRFFLDHLPQGAATAHIVDLGCGNGVVGLAAALLNPRAQLTFLDESYQAVASAEATFRANTAPDRAARFLAADGLTDADPASVDLVLNNPPFHTHQATSDTTAWRMFSDSRRALRPGGELWVVGNRHLGYPVKLKRLFGNCDVVASHPKFVVMRAVKR